MAVALRQLLRRAGGLGRPPPPGPGPASLQRHLGAQAPPGEGEGQGKGAGWRQWVEAELSEKGEGEAAAGAAGTAGAAGEGGEGLPPPVTAALAKQGYSPLARAPSAKRAPILPGSQKSLGGPQEVTPRIHPSRLHFPGQRYNPEDLDPYAPYESVPFWMQKKRAGGRARPGAVAFDFKHAARLAQFTTDELKIKPRRYTRLTMKQQRQMEKAVKTARQMGFIRNPGQRG